MAPGRLVWASGRWWLCTCHVHIDPTPVSPAQSSAASPGYPQSTAGASPPAACPLLGRHRPQGPPALPALLPGPASAGGSQGTPDAVHIDLSQAPEALLRLLRPPDLIGQVQPGQEKFLPVLGEGDGPDDAAHLLVGNLAPNFRHGFTADWRSRRGVMYSIATKGVESA
jgi:hypothetical protein